MNLERVSSESNQSNKLNIIEEAILRAEARKRADDLSDQHFDIDADFDAEDSGKTAPLPVSTAAFPSYRLRLQFATIGIICTVIGAAIMWGLVQSKFQPKVDQPIINSNISAEVPDPNWSGLKMSYQVTELASANGSKGYTLARETNTK